MRLLADTHVLLWVLKEPQRLTPGARAAVTSGANQVFFSAASIAEVAIKTGKRRLEVEGAFLDWLARENFIHLPVTAEHAWYLRTLPFHHKDPFDRLLVAQAQVEGLTLVTRDKEIRRYDVAVLPA